MTSSLISNILTTTKIQIQNVRTDDIIAGIILFLVGCCGITANITAIRIISKLSSLKHCFGNLLLLHASAEAVVTAIFIFWTTPISIFHSSISMSMLGRKIGHLGLFYYYICFYVQLLKSINRLVAISSPLTYRKYFSDQKSKYSILIVIFLAATQSIIYFFPGCDFYFDPESHLWTFADTPCSVVISPYIDFVYGCTFMAVVIFIDCLTFLLIQKYRTTLNNQQRKGIQFFKQAFCTSLLYVLQLISFHLAWRLTSDPWIIFCSTSLAWELCHVLDGISMMLFNSKLRKSTPVASLNTMASKEVFKTQSTKPPMTRVL